MIEAATRSLKAGYQHGESSGLMPVRYRVGKATMSPGRYRQVTGTDALALGLLSAAELADLSLVFASYPIVPASGLLHRLCEWKQPHVTVTQAEDALAALNIARRLRETRPEAELKDAVVVTIFCDSASKYLSESFWNDAASEAENWP